MSLPILLLYDESNSYNCMHVRTKYTSNNSNIIRVLQIILKYLELRLILSLLQEISY